MSIVLDILQPCRPFIDLPEIPVEREAVHRYCVDLVKNALPFEVADEVNVDRRHSAENPHQARTRGGNSFACRYRQFGESREVGIDLRIPVRFVVRLVPYLHRFDHSAAPDDG
jgi:hypothetical protein